MRTECSSDLFGFAAVEGREVVGGFDGGAITSEAGALLLGAADRAIKLTERFAACFHDTRRQHLIEHEVVTLLTQQVFGIALGYEDLNDHDELRHDPMMAVLAGKLAARREDCAPVAGKSTLNRLELSRLQPTRYHRISHNPIAIKRLLVDLFVDAHERPPQQIILDLDATDDPVHGEQEGRFFHGYYDCYCYLPLYVFCGRHLLAAKLRPASMDAAAGAAQEVARIVAQIRRRWPHVRILVRADSGFAREELMAWCEANGVHFLFGLQKNDRLVAEITSELERAEAKSRRTDKPARYFREFRYRTRRSWSRERRVIGKAEVTKDEANPRFVVTSLKRAECKPKYLYEKLYCSIFTPIVPRPPRCAPTSCAYGWHHSPTSCSAPCAGSDCITHRLPTRAAAPSVSSCSRSARSCASASAASRSRWHRAVQRRRSGAARPSVSPPPVLAARQPDTRRRSAEQLRHHPRTTETRHSLPPQPRKIPAPLASLAPRAATSLKAVAQTARSCKDCVRYPG